MLETFKTIVQIFALFWVAVNNASVVVRRFRRWLKMRQIKDKARKEEG